MIEIKWKAVHELTLPTSLVSFYTPVLLSHSPSSILGLLFPELTKQCPPLSFVPTVPSDQGSSTGCPRAVSFPSSGLSSDTHLFREGFLLFPSQGSTYVTMFHHMTFISFIAFIFSLPSLSLFLSLSLSLSFSFSPLL